LFGAEGVLAAFAASEREKGDVGVEAASEICEDGGGFVVRVGGYVEDAGGNAGAVDGFDSFGKAPAGAGRGRKLGGSRMSGDQVNEEGQNWGDRGFLHCVSRRKKQFLRG
jgi:hypothetical protein